MFWNLRTDLQFHFTWNRPQTDGVNDMYAKVFNRLFFLLFQNYPGKEEWGWVPPLEAKEGWASLYSLFYSLANMLSTIVIT